MGEEAKSISDELSDMAASYDASKDKEGDEDVDTNVDDSGDDDKGASDDAGGDDTGSDDDESASGSDDEGGDDEGDGEGEGESDERDEQIADLKAKIVEMESAISSITKGVGKPKDEKVDVGVTHDVIDFVGDESVTDIVDSKEGLNKFANEVLAKATDLVNKGVEKTLLAVPQLAIRQMNNASKLNKIVRDFYGANEDLVKYKGVVGAMINKVTSENPDYGLDKVLGEAAKETRKALNLKEKAIGGKNKTTNKNNPAFSKQSGKRTSGKKPTLKGVQKEIDDLID